MDQINIEYIFGNDPNHEDLDDIATQTSKEKKEFAPFKPKFATTLESDFQSLMKQRFLASESGAKYEASGKIDYLGMAHKDKPRNIRSRNTLTEEDDMEERIFEVDTSFTRYEQQDPSLLRSAKENDEDQHIQRDDSFPVGAAGIAGLAGLAGAGVAGTAVAAKVGAGAAMAATSMTAATPTATPTAMATSPIDMEDPDSALGDRSCSVTSSIPSRTVAREQYNAWVDAAIKKYEIGVSMKRVREKGQLEERVLQIEEKKVLRLLSKNLRVPHMKSVLDVTSLNLGFAKDRFQKAKEKGEELHRDSCMTVNFDSESWYLMFPSVKERNTFAFLLRVLRRSLMASAEELK